MDARNPGHGDFIGGRLDVALDDCWYARPQLFYKFYLRPKHGRLPSHWHSSPVLSLVRTSILALEQITQDSFQQDLNLLLQLTC